MDNVNKKILVVGSSAAAYALVKKISSYSGVEKVFVASGAPIFSDIAECVDIREDNPAELLEFVLENSIDFSVCCSELAIKSDIATVFASGGQLIFAPSKQSALSSLSRAAAKKFLYKQRIPTPKFGIFDKQQLAFDYLKNASFPLIIKCDENQFFSDKFACLNVSDAKTYIEELFLRGEKKVILEDYIYGHDFTFYVITDGYKVLPIVSSADYKFASDGDGGLFTSGVGAFAPDYKISAELENVLLNDVAVRVVNSLEKNGAPYVGILGFDVVLSDEGGYFVTGYKPFFANHDADLILSLIDENIFQLFMDCAVGSFADDYEFIRLNGKSGVSAVISSYSSDEKVVEGLDAVLDDGADVSFINVRKNEYFEYIAQKGNAFVITRTASTLSTARNLLYEDIDAVSFSGKKYRKDICQPVK